MEYWGAYGVKKGGNDFLLLRIGGMKGFSVSYFFGGIHVFTLSFGRIVIIVFPIHGVMLLVYVLLSDADFPAFSSHIVFHRFVVIFCLETGT
jgi:hypothetical protein